MQAGLRGHGGSVQAGFVSHGWGFRATQVGLFRTGETQRDEWVWPCQESRAEIGAENRAN